MTSCIDKQHSGVRSTGRRSRIQSTSADCAVARRQLTFSQIFTIVAIPGLIAAAALMIKQLAHPDDTAARAAARHEALGH